jgi:hypothetical protein
VDEFLNDLVLADAKRFHAFFLGRDFFGRDHGKKQDGQTEDLRLE